MWVRPSPPHPHASLSASEKLEHDLLLLQKWIVLSWRGEIKFVIDFFNLQFLSLRTTCRNARHVLRSSTGNNVRPLGAYQRAHLKADMLALREKRKRNGEGATEATETTDNNTTGSKPDHHGDEDPSIDQDDDGLHDDDDLRDKMK